MAITYGMSIKEFWEDNPDLFWAYRFSYFTKLKSNQELFNQNAWLQGAYFHEAVSVALHNTFSKQKITYTNSPYGVKKEELKEETIKKQSEILTKRIMERVSQVQAIKGEDKSSTTEKGNTKGGEIRRG